MARFASFWFGGSLSGFERYCISSFIQWGHSFQLYSYDPELAVPEGCELVPAESILPRDKVFFYSESPDRKVSAFSNMFRYSMIYETGTCWVDTDVVCLGADFVESPYVFARQDEEYFNGAILRFPAGHEAMRLASEYCWEVRKISVWGDLGPRLMTKVIAEYGLENEAVDTHLLYPVHWRDAIQLFDPSEREHVATRVSGAMMLHLWNETFSTRGISKNQMPPPGSYLAESIRASGAERFFS